MKAFKCIIVDDEPLALDVLNEYIRRLDFLELAGRCKNSMEALNYLQKGNIDLVLLDIQMPMLTGVDLLRTLKKPPKVILTTAYREYALQGYELNVVDFLLKPISFERFLSAIDKAFPINDRIPVISSGQSKKDSAEPFIYVKSNKKMLKAYLRDILYIEAKSDYVKIKTKQKEILSYQTLSALEDKLSVSNFMRIHKSYLINLDNVNAFTATEIEIDGLCLPIGRNYKNETLRRLGMDSKDAE